MQLTQVAVSSLAGVTNYTLMYYDRTIERQTRLPVTHLLHDRIKIGRIVLPAAANDMLLRKSNN